MKEKIIRNSTRQQVSTTKQNDKAKNLLSPFHTPLIHAKLLVGTRDTPLEHEADQAAENFVDIWQNGTLTAPVEKPATMPTAPLIQRRAISPEAGAVPASPEVTQQIQSAQGGGQPLPVTLQPSLEAAFGMDFSGVRLHTDHQADALNQDLQARAFTTGRDIFFRQGEYQPGTTEGVRLLGHELGHVGQQQVGGGHHLQRWVSEDVTSRIEGDSRHMGDAVFEQLAHAIAYTSMDAAIELARESGFECHPYSGTNGLRFFVFLPDKETRQTNTIIAFTGSEPGLIDGLADDWVSDLTDSEPGTRQYNPNIELIRDVVRQYDRVDVTGHSLGGALAQLLAADMPEKIGRIVTFQAPGIRSILANRIRQHNRDRRARGEAGIESTHYRVRHDIVDDAGEEHSEGTVIEMDFDSTTFGPLNTASIPGELGRVGWAHPSSPLSLFLDHANERKSIRANVSSTENESLNTRPVEQLRQLLARDASQNIGGLGGLRTFFSQLEQLDSAIVTWCHKHPDDLSALPLQVRRVMIELLLAGTVTRDELLAIGSLFRSAPEKHRSILLQDYRSAFMAAYLAQGVLVPGRAIISAGVTTADSLSEFGRNLGEGIYSLTHDEPIPTTRERGISNLTEHEGVFAPIPQVEQIIHIMESGWSLFYIGQYDLGNEDINRIRSLWNSISNETLKSRARREITPYIQNVIGSVQRSILTGIISS